MYKNIILLYLLNKRSVGFGFFACNQLERSCLIQGSAQDYEKSDPGYPWIPGCGTEAGSRYPPGPLFWNLARIPVPPGSPLVEASPDPGTPRIPTCGT